MSEYESNDIEMDYGEQEEQNEEENENENDNNEEGEEQNNYNYNETNNYNNNINNTSINNNSINNNYDNSNNNYNNINNNNINNNKNNINQNETEDEQENNISNNVYSNKYPNNYNNNINNNKKNQFSENSNSQDINLVKNENNEKEEINEEMGENPEILYEEFFNYFLPSKKNSLNIKECKNAMRCLGLVVTEREIQDFLEIKEKTGKEKINLEKFKAICNKKLNETNNNYDELEKAFEMLDSEKTGIVNSMVLRHQMKIFKPKITDEEINQILSEFGEDKNGNINYREYLNNLKS